MKNVRNCFLLCHCHQITALTLINAKNSDRNEIEKKKTAFGDIKNAPQLFGSSEKSGVKKDERVKESVDDYDSGCVSLMPVDYFEAQVNKLALSDDEIDLWIKCINASRNASRYDDDIEPPTIYEPELAELPEDECK